MRVGKFNLHLATDGEFRLDGGAMFGVVPRALWEFAKPPDDRNRIRMTTNCLLIEGQGRLILVDTGIGDKNDDKFLDMFAVEKGAERLLQSIARCGFEPEDVTDVVLTHLHFDHCGWNTRVVDGELCPTFSNARYWLEAGEVAHARAPNARDRASYLPDNWEPLFEAGVVELFEDEAEPVPGVRVIKAPGHNADMCMVLVAGVAKEEAGEENGPPGAIYFADLVPTAAHVSYPWIMSYDLYPMQTLANKESWIPRAAEEGWLCIFEHDPEIPAGYLVERKPGRYSAKAVAWKDGREEGSKVAVEK